MRVQLKLTEIMPYINVLFILIIHLIRLLFSKKLQFGLSCIYLIILRKYIKNLQAVVRRWSVKKVFLEISQNSQEDSCARVSFLLKLQASGLQLYLKRGFGTSASCEFCNISKNTFCYRTPPVAASE